MGLLGNFADLLSAVRGHQPGYPRPGFAPDGTPLEAPKRCQWDWREALTHYKFLRKVRTWKESGVQFGDGVMVMASVFIDTSYGWMIKIGDRTRLAEEVRILCHDAQPQRDLSYGRVGPVSIGRDCILNERVIVFPGVTIGDGCLIGSGSVVATDIPPGSRAMGVPARVYGTVQDYLRELREGMSQAPVFQYRELHNLAPDARERALALMHAAGNRGFYHDPFSTSFYWATPPKEPPRLTEIGPELALTLVSAMGAELALALISDLAPFVSS